MGQITTLGDVLSVEAIERARDILNQSDIEDPRPLLVTTRQARTIYMVPGSVIRIMRQEAMHWRGQYLKVVD